MPGFLKAFGILLPFVFRIQIGFVVGRETLDLFLVYVNEESVVVLWRNLQPVRRYKEFLARKPATSVNHHIANAAGGMIEDHVFNFAQLLVISAINL